jgi:hypothetical protein
VDFLISGRKSIKIKSAMRGGRRPGAGRKPGSKNKATIEREERARIEYMARSDRREAVDGELARDAAAAVDQAKRTGDRLGKEILHELANLLADVATYYQPRPVAVQQPDGSVTTVLRGGDEAKFRQYAHLAMQAAKDLAPYQSPKLSAVVLGTAVKTEYVVTGGLPDEEDGGLIDAPPDVGTIDLSRPLPGQDPGPAPGGDRPDEVPPGSGTG